MADQDTIAGGNPNPRTPYKEGNTDADGNYIVGKGRTPDAGKFRKGDKRKRGRRPKSTANLDTDVMDEAKARITVNEGGKAVVITKQQAMVKRMFDKAFSGDVAAMRQAFDMIQKIGDRKAQERGHKLPQNDRKIVEQYLADLAVSLGDDFETPLEGDLRADLGVSAPYHNKEVGDDRE